MFLAFYIKKNILKTKNKVWDDKSASSHSKTYTSGYRRVNRQRYRKRSEECDADYTSLGTLPQLGECIRLVNNSIFYTGFFREINFTKIFEKMISRKISVESKYFLHECVRKISEIHIL